MSTEDNEKIGCWLVAAAIGSIVFPILIPIPIILALYLWLNKNDSKSHTKVSYQHRYAAARKAKAAGNIHTEIWHEHWLDITESPVERLFLQTLIKELHLKPQGNYLLNSWLTVEPQKIVGRYRVDFLVITNNQVRHVIEIDGKSYHLSPKQIAYDKERDFYISNLGYVITRVPAADIVSNVEKAVSNTLSKILD
jgi:very-short-patch-repair endonuclease